jgi:hypothetical protein
MPDESPEPRPAAAVSTPPGEAPTSAEGLSMLLANDDSVQGHPAAVPCSASARGLAPCTEESASGSPADAVLVGLRRFVPDNYWPNGPDVLTGTTGARTSARPSSTRAPMGRRSRAAESGLSAVAFSAAFDPTCTPDPFACVPFSDTASRPTPMRWPATTSRPRRSTRLDRRADASDIDEVIDGL